MSPLAQVRTFRYKKYGFFCPFFASPLFNKFKRLTYLTAYRMPYSSCLSSFHLTVVLCRNKKRSLKAPFKTLYVQYYQPLT
ncbi:hypothetical protein Sbal183_3970 [Shewanella baltica OS183]|nr:hypothetical protein Sbal175_0351 [Shewanella baltica BA175]EHQ16837.1 hypothetical protein Sbal183_3970 [Shewanella baltica OS183]